RILPMTQMHIYVLVQHVLLPSIFSLYLVAPCSIRQSSTTLGNGSCSCFDSTLTLVPSPDRSGVWFRPTHVHPALQMTCCVHIGSIEDI
ncbi:hypothetical protein COCMIDRAFT_101801, partial [Bipolaris oryzae ATCC 44560]